MTVQYGAFHQLLYVDVAFCGSFAARCRITTVTGANLVSYAVEMKLDMR